MAFCFRSKDVAKVNNISDICNLLNFFLEYMKFRMRYKAGLISNKAGLFSNKGALLRNKGGLLRNTVCYTSKCVTDLSRLRHSGSYNFVFHEIAATAATDLLKCL